MKFFFQKSLSLTLGGLLSAIAVNANPSEMALEKIKASTRPLSGFKVVKSEKSFRGCPLHHLVLTGPDPIDFKERKVQVKMYLPRGATLESAHSSRTVLLLPPTGGENRLDQAQANSLCSAGIRVALIVGWDRQLDTELSLAMHDKGVLRSLAAIHHVLDYLNPVSDQQMGILGTSIGAFSSALALGYDPRLASGVLVVGAGELADVIACSDEQGATQLREMRMKSFEFSSQLDYQSALRKQVTLDPIQFAGYTGPKKVLSVIAEEDLTVPTQYQERLAQALDAKQIIRIKGSHFSAIVRTTLFYSEEIKNFFLQNLVGK